MNKIKFSVIVPVYNVEKYIEECLDSILKQDYDNYEILLIDDGSTDKSGNICEIYASKNEKIKVFHKKNGGLSSARNFGLERATGDYVVFVDSDDYIASWSLTEFYKILKNKNFDILETRLTEVIGEEKKYLDEHLEKYFSQGFNKERAIEWIIKQSENIWPAQKKIVSLSYIKKNNLKFWEGKLHEDVDWTSRICYTANSYTALIRPWYYYRVQREGSITSSVKLKNVLSILEIAEFHYNYYIKNRNETTQKIIEEIIKGVCSLLSKSCYLTTEEKKEIKKYLEKNKNIFNVIPNLKCRVFILVIKIFGIERILNLLKVIKYR